jgi:hypothetical protein
MNRSFLLFTFAGTIIITLWYNYYNKKRLDDQKEQKRLDDQKEQKRLDDQKEQKRLDDQKEQKRLDYQTEQHRLDYQTEQHKLDDQTNLSKYMFLNTNCISLQDIPEELEDTEELESDLYEDSYISSYSNSDESIDSYIKFDDWKDLLNDISEKNGKNYIIYDSTVSDLDLSQEYQIIDDIRNHDNRFWLKLN